MSAGAPAIADQIGAFAAALDWRDLPAPVAERTRDRVLDALATAIAGREADPYRPVSALLAAEPAGDATVLATGRTSGATAAAFANGVAIHALLFEDLNLASADHPGAVIVPAALAAAETQRGGDATLADLLLGILAGYEVQLALGEVAGKAMIGRGFRTTSVLGTVGAAVAAGRVWRLPAAELACAASIAASFAGGLTEGWSHGSHEPYLQAGLAAQQGLLAARLAMAGAASGRLAFEGATGFLRAFAGLSAEELPRLDGAWRIRDIICKPYPCSGGKIGAIDSARELVESGLDAAAIEAVRVFLPPVYLAYPGADRAAPFGSMSQAQASGQFCVAAALLGYDMEAVETFTRGFAAPDIAALSCRIELVPGSGLSLSRVEVRLRDGSMRAAEVDSRDRQVPSLASMTEKLKRLSRNAWLRGVSDEVAELVAGPVSLPIARLSVKLRNAA